MEADLEAAKKVLERFVNLLTNGSKNRDSMLSVNHDALRAAVRDARSTLSQIEGSGM